MERRRRPCYCVQGALLMDCRSIILRYHTAGKIPWSLQCGHNMAWRQAANEGTMYTGVSACHSSGWNSRHNLPAKIFPPHKASLHISTWRLRMTSLAIWQLHVEETVQWTIIILHAWRHFALPLHPYEYRRTLQCSAEIGNTMLNYIICQIGITAVGLNHIKPRTSGRIRASDTTTSAIRAISPPPNLPGIMSDCPCPLSDEK